MKTLLLVLPIALLPTLFSFAQAGQAPSETTLPIGYISPQRILAESAAGKANVARFQSAQQEKTNQLRALQQTLEATRQKLARAPIAGRPELQRQEQLQRTDLERANAQAQADLQALQRQLNADLQVKLRPHVDDLAGAKKLRLILNEDTSIMWAAPGMDLTASLIERLDGKTAAAPPKQ
jgi:Skp family chaperone for outer membrane proteins